MQEVPQPSVQGHGLEIPRRGGSGRPKGAEFVPTWVPVKTDGIFLGSCLEIAKLLAHGDDLARFGRKEFKVRPGCLGMQFHPDQVAGKIEGG